MLAFHINYTFGTICNSISRVVQSYLVTLGLLPKETQTRNHSSFRTTSIASSFGDEKTESERNLGHLCK